MHRFFVYDPDGVIYGESTEIIAQARAGIEYSNFT